MSALRHFHRPFVALVLVAAACGLWAGSAQAGQQGAARYLDRVRDEPQRLHTFLWAMPKGADLHMHLTGAIYAEEMLSYAAEDGKCADPVTYTATYPPCEGGLFPLADALTDNVLQNEVLKAWSMKGFIPGEESGHDHFFATFDKFGAAISGHLGEGLATVTKRARSQNVDYLEVLTTPAFGQVRSLALSIPWTGDFATFRQGLIDAGILDLVPVVQAQMDQLYAEKAQYDPSPRPVVRFNVQMLRANPPPVAFAQMLLGFELMKADPRWRAVNLVQPEDDLVALRNYRIQMRMLGYLRGVYPKGHITLHAGELTQNLARPSDLRFHIRMAVQTARAERIGHGVSIFSERNPLKLVREMARKRILVESPLVSNQQILGVTGKRHPIRFYVSHGVPVALATDDEGVSRSNLTEQFQIAVTDHGFGYFRLKRFARDSLRYSFLPRGLKKKLLAEQAREFKAFEAKFRG